MTRIPIDFSLFWIAFFGTAMFVFAICYDPIGAVQQRYENQKERAADLDLCALGVISTYHTDRYKSEDDAFNEARAYCETLPQ